VRHADRRIVARGAGRTDRSRSRSAGSANLRIQPALPVPGPEFAALQPDERAFLQDWQARASAIGIDAVQDLRQRSWPCPIADTIIGIYRDADELASWLVVGHAGQWVVSCCNDGAVSRSLGSLADALTLVYQLAGVYQPGTMQSGTQSIE
jgi:hypothetical protein